MDALAVPRRIRNHVAVVDHQDREPFDLAEINRRLARLDEEEGR